MNNKANITIKIALAILITFLIIEIIPVLIGIIKYIQGDPKAYGYILIPFVSLISTIGITIPAIFIARSFKRKDDEDTETKEVSEIDKNAK